MYSRCIYVAGCWLRRYSKTDLLQGSLSLPVVVFRKQPASCKLMSGAGATAIAFCHWQWLSASSTVCCFAAGVHATACTCLFLKTYAVIFEVFDTDNSGSIDKVFLFAIVRALTGSHLWYFVVGGTASGTQSKHGAYKYRLRIVTIDTETLTLRC
jgi:hypothetical protein